MQRKLLRLIDANFNRVREGLRVCEDLFRFIDDNRELTASFKRLRHDCTKAFLAFPVPYRKLVQSRDQARDVGRASVIQVQKKLGWKALVIANMKRAEEGLRVLEEVSKLIGVRRSHRFQKLRFRLYGLEKKVLKRL